MVHGTQYKLNTFSRKYPIILLFNMASCRFTELASLEVREIKFINIENHDVETTFHSRLIPTAFSEFRKVNEYLLGITKLFLRN